MATAKHSYGWVPDVPDKRDWRYAASAPIAIPSSLDLSDKFPSAYDQGQLGSCTANAIAAAHEYEQIRQGLQHFMPSRLFIYYEERVKENTVNSDSGAQIRDGIKSVAEQGACPEEIWPYDIGAFATQPSARAYASGVSHKALSYYSVPRDTTQMLTCLSERYPIVIGISVYESFESDEVAQTGVVPMPSSSEQLLGGHAVLIVGFDQGSKRYKVRNSWGPDWGIRGYFTLPFEYLTDEDLSDDFWSIRLVK